MQTVEELRDILLELQRENAALRVSASHGKLLFAGMEQLLSVDDQTDPFAIAFHSLREVFEFADALALKEEDDGLLCIAADNPTRLNRRWPVSSLMRKVLKGRAVATVTGDNGNDSDDDDDAGSDRPALILPIKMQDRRGALVLQRPAGAPGFDRNDVSLGQRFSLLSSQALEVRRRHQSENENRRLQDLTQELEHRAYYDQLTGLANRALLQRRVEAALEDRRNRADAFALAFIDVDKFKQINDYYGHSLGDLLLIQIAERISRAIRPSDSLGRISGDEYLLLIDPIVDRAELARMIAHVAKALDAPYSIEGHEIHASVSIGVSVCPEHGDDYETLRRNADSAMYRAKGSRRDGLIFYDVEMGRDLTARMELEGRLRRAIRDRGFFCALQPKIDLNTATVAGFEALVRWRDEAGVIHAPGEFVGVATELGLLDEISGIVAEKALEAFALLDPVFGDETSIAINIAPVQANDQAFISGLLETLTASGLASRIVLELTEDAMVGAQHFRGFVQPMLLENGVRVSIDDFGTGYSCLSALAGIQADELKIDRSFITDVHKDPLNQRILFTIENLAQAIGLQIVAEGVETREELDFLLTHTSIEMAQGYFFARPVSAEQLVALGPALVPTDARRVTRVVARRPELISSLRD